MTFAESPTSPRARDRIAVSPIHIDTIARLHAEADATGRSIGDIAADWLDQWQPLAPGRCPECGAETPGCDC